MISKVNDVPRLARGIGWRAKVRGTKDREI